MFDQLFINEAAWFGVPALIGTAVFVIRITFMLLGGVGDLDDGGMDLAGDVGDADLGDADAAADDSGHAFTVLSVQSVAAFCMGFGWGGIGALNGAGWSVPVSMGVAGASGVAMVWLLAWLLRVIFALQSSGNLSASSAIGATGEVYATVPEHAKGSGQVRVVVGNRQRIYNAVTEGDALPTRSRVRVLAVTGDNTLTVTPA